MFVLDRFATYEHLALVHDISLRVLGDHYLNVSET